MACANGAIQMEFEVSPCSVQGFVYISPLLWLLEGYPGNFRSGKGIPDLSFGMRMALISQKETLQLE